MEAITAKSERYSKFYKVFLMSDKSIGNILSFGDVVDYAHKVDYIKKLDSFVVQPKVGGEIYTFSRDKETKLYTCCFGKYRRQLIGV
jgi:hypothetical protein